jgi:hypothetical protein
VLGVFIEIPVLTALHYSASDIGGMRSRWPIDRSEAKEALTGRLTECIALLSRIEIRIGKPKDLSLLICLKAAPESHVLLLQLTLLQSLAAALNILLPGASFGSPIAAACVRDQGPVGGIVGVGLRPAL